MLVYPCADTVWMRKTADELYLEKVHEGLRNGNITIGDMMPEEGWVLK